MKKLVSLFLFCWSIGAFAQKEKINVTDLARIKTLSNITASPDGSKILYVLNTIEQNDENKLEYDYRSQLWLSDFTTTRPLTRSEGNPRQATWSADGKQIAFVRTYKGKAQVFVMPTDGGEAYQLTNISYGASSPKWAPDGSRILFSVSLTLNELLKDTLLNPRKTVPSWSIEKPGFKNNNFIKLDQKVKANPDGTLDEIRAYLRKDEEDKKAKVFNRLNFQGESVTEPEIRFNILMSIETREGAKPIAVSRGFWSYNNAQWTPEGKIIATCGRDTLQHPDRELSAAIVLMNANGTDAKTLVQQPGWTYGNPVLSSDGKLLAYTGSQNNWLGFSRLFLANADGSNAQQIEFDRAPSNLTWSSDGQFLYFTASSNGGVPLFRLSTKTRKVEQLSDFESGVTDFDLLKNQIVFAKTEIANPSEIYTADLAMKNQKKLSNHNEWVSKKLLSFPEKRTFKNEKGQTVEYWIMKPTVVEATKKYPLLLNIHGGPTAMWGPGEASMWHEFQYQCAMGYGVVYSNPRGSGGYGKDFQFANYQDWGKGPASDVLTATSTAANESWADTARQVITGGSYAGYLVAWIVGHDHRFKAAFAQRGVYDLTTFMGEGNAWRLVPNYFGGYPWDTRTKQILERESPYSYIDKIKTPLLIKHGENDLRTGVIQSEMMFRSLKILGRETEYVQMPGATHELSRSGNVRQRIDRLLRIYEFFERYVGK
jgi:dipeptidyl aminopeptidase/acylaminoacyl peptidase